ncbi:hypothetical protein ASPFODRAFT_697629 [Aspergillus luchuensis CBS 106.47]|uniref:Uncharacterized protein n=1 Tax=Aspergillus luchuensis (strain CBS 106.47) TaxID=1137211 RepID=A0A1M3U1X6_ASPLC|nr:hypothetical protein ASPFODRAFT_697629 [Aspergillus luchuensis CBS 106.47]
MSGLAASVWAGGPAVVAAAGAGEDPNRGGRRGRDGKKPPADRVTVPVDLEACPLGCGLHHPGQPCPLAMFCAQVSVEAFRANRAQHLNEAYAETLEKAGQCRGGLPSSPPPNVGPGGTRPPRPSPAAQTPTQRRRMRRQRARAARGGANALAPGGSNLRPAPVAAEGGNVPAGNRARAARRENNHRWRRSHDRRQEWRTRPRGERQAPAENDQLAIEDAEMLAIEPSGEHESLETDAQDDMGHAERATSPACEDQSEEVDALGNLLSHLDTQDGTPSCRANSPSPTPPSSPPTSP